MKIGVIGLETRCLVEFEERFAISILEQELLGSFPVQSGPLRFRNASRSQQTGHDPGRQQ